MTTSKMKFIIETMTETSLPTNNKATIRPNDPIHLNKIVLLSRIVDRMDTCNGEKMATA